MNVNESVLMIGWLGFPKPKPETVEMQEQAAMPAEVLKEETPDCQQEELNLPLK